MFQQTFKSSVRRPMPDHRENVFFPSEPSVRKTMLSFFQKYFALVYVKLYR